MSRTTLDEIWKPINGFSDYQVSNYGRVKSLKAKTPLILKPRYCKGYVIVSLRKDGRTYERRVNRLVAEAFIPNPNNYPCVNHKDEVKDNNVVWNLEWCSVAYNNAYNGRADRIAKVKTKPIYQYTIAGEFIRCWDSTKEAAAYYKCTRENIQTAIKGRIETAVGYKWSYCYENHI